MAKYALARRPFPVSYAKPIVVRQTKIVKAKHKHRRHGGGAGFMNRDRMGIVGGAAALAFIQKQGIKLPALPLVGETGTIALAAYFLSGNGKNKLASEVCTAACVLAIHELITTGAIVGEGDGSDGWGF
jgi:hypothetical protein